MSEQWTTIIKPERKWYEVNLRELWQYRDLIYMFVKRDFIAKYKQTILGPLWFILQPLITTVVFNLIFNKIAKISTSGVPPFLFYFSGLLVWNYFSKVFTTTANTFVTGAGIYRKVYFPRLVVPISSMISNLFQFFIQFVFFLGFWVYFKMMGASIEISLWAILLFPVLIIWMALLGFGLGMIFTALLVKYRDFNILLGFGVQLWMYLTPIIYPYQLVPKQVEVLVKYNPVTPIVEVFRFVFLGTGYVDGFMIGYSAIFTLVSLALGLIVFSKVEQYFVDIV